MAYEQLSVENPIFDITQQIEQADSSMMIRELVDNAIIASAKANKGKVKFIKFDPSILGLPYTSKNKFAIWNNGVGLDPHRLVKITNLASSLDKIQGLKENFGKGAKMASLSVNKKGMIFISCKNQNVNYLVLGEAERNSQDEPIYGRFHLSESGDVTADCTEEMLNAGFDISEDWFMVVLCRNEFGQDTIKEPFGSKISTGWAFNDVYTRFFRIPKNVEMRFEVGHSKGNMIPKFLPISQYIDNKAKNNPDKMKHEWVDVNDNINQGLKVWYIWDGPWGGSASNDMKPTSTIGNPATRSMFSGLVYKNETYAISDGNTWKQDASFMGILAGSNFLRVFVELPDNFNCQPDLYRKNLEFEYIENGRKWKEPLTIRNFAKIIYDNMPEWFRQKCLEYDNAKSADNNVVQKLTDLLSKLSMKETKQVPVSVSNYKAGSGAEKGAGVTGKNSGGNGSGSQTRHNPNSNGGCNKGKNLTKIFSSKFKKSMVTKSVPEIKYIWSDKELDEYGLPDNFKYRAGHFQRSIDKEIIFINCTSLQFNEIYDFTVKKFNSELKSDEFVTDDYAKNISRDTLTWLVGSVVVRALSQEARTGWTNSDIEKVLNPETLSVYADCWDSEIPTISSNVKEACKLISLEVNNQ